MYIFSQSFCNSKIIKINEDIKHALNVLLNPQNIIISIVVELPLLFLLSHPVIVSEKLVFIYYELFTIAVCSEHASTYYPLSIFIWFLVKQEKTHLLILCIDYFIC